LELSRTGLSAHGACNLYSVPIWTDGHSLRASQRTPNQTDEGCERAVLAVDEVYFDALPRLQVVETINSENLVLVGPDVDWYSGLRCRVRGEPMLRPGREPVRVGQR
jgi:hypothetical protein